ncbi:hypothetical protein [Geomonas subterranea]|uniref:hypothetical protein n=1 Tax=Geomonas subterranea TaxID=2847989 RepID=UPI001CD21708|nr:hypothetical protein [Geomonas fuzhouensis]
MKKVALSMFLLLISYGPARAEDCDCQPFEYQQLMALPVGEIQAKIEQYERLKERYIHGGSTYCYYTCVTAYEQLRDAKVAKQRSMTRGRAAGRAAEEDVLQREPSR